MIGGLIIGLIESLGGQLIAVRWTDVIIFSILILVLVFVPNGLFGRATPDQILMAEIGKPPPVRTTGLRPTLRARAGTPLLRPIARIRPGNWARLGIVCAAVAALLFPLVHRNDADIDTLRQCARLRRAGARPQYRRRLCRPARPRLCGVFRDRRLCLRHSQLVAIAAGMDEFLGAVPVARPRRAQSYDGRRLRPFPGVVLADAAGFGGDRRILRRAVRRSDLAAQRRLSGDRDFGLWRDRADRRAQLAVLDQWRDGSERGRPAAVLRLQFRGQRDPLLLRRGGARRPVDPDQPAAEGFAHRARLDGDPRGRDRRLGDGRQPGSTASCWPSPPAPPSPAPPARSTSPNCRPRRRTCSCFRCRS